MRFLPRRLLPPPTLVRSPLTARTVLVRALRALADRLDPEDDGNPVCEHCGKEVRDGDPLDFAPYCSAACDAAGEDVLVLADDEDEGCPKGDPDCYGPTDGSHDACERPVPEGKRLPITSAESQTYIDNGELPDAGWVPAGQLIEDTVYAGMCFGAEGVNGEPICDGPDVKRVRAKAPGVPFEQGDGWFTTDWCAECRATAEVDGYIVQVVEQGAGS